MIIMNSSIISDKLEHTNKQAGL
uniref:Uncharacterized protein n=1 Tax=Arundo donax TaxID=35708 RepID=A0A0A9TJ32_ARUDO